jgi:hypothetical protein
MATTFHLLFFYLAPMDGYFRQSLRLMAESCPCLSANAAGLAPATAVKPLANGEDCKIIAKTSKGGQRLSKRSQSVFASHAVLHSGTIHFESGLSG